MLSSKSLFSLASAGVLMFLGGGAQAAIYYVNVNTGADSNPGTPAKPLKTIQKSITLATFGSTINVAAGTYHESLSWKTKYLNIIGAGPDLSIIDPSVAHGGPGGRCLYTEALGAICGISGFTFQFGSGGSFGGGMYNKSSALAVSHCTFLQNSAGMGAGMYNGGSAQSGGSNPTVTQCAFTGNTANDDGGGMANFAGSKPGVTQCTFSGNFADGGGGMANFENSNPNVENCDFSDNQAPGGGGMYNHSSSPEVRECSFTNNRGYLGGGMLNMSTLIADGFGGVKSVANSGSNPLVNSCNFRGNISGSGGGMYNSYSSPDVSHCFFFGNSGSKGGGMLTDSGNPTVTLCAFSSNTATYGGGVANGGGGSTYIPQNQTFLNCTFTGNIANKGGGMFNAGSSPTVGGCVFNGNTAANSGGAMYNANTSKPYLVNCTLAYNTVTSASGNGGGIANAFSFDVISSAPNNGGWPNVSLDNWGDAVFYRPRTVYTFSISSLVNCIVWANTAPSAPGIVGNTGVGYSDVQNGGYSNGNIAADPLFMDKDNLRLKPGSPCIDRGNKAGVNSLLLLTDADNSLIDLDLNPRLFGSQIDMGAYEQSLSDVTGQVSVTRGAIQYGSIKGTLTQVVTLRNTGSAAIVGPISLILDRLTNCTLTNAGGTTQFFSPYDRPYIYLPGSNLAPGAVVTLTLQFTQTVIGPLPTYTTQVIAGPSNR